MDIDLAILYTIENQRLPEIEMSIFLYDEYLNLIDFNIEQIIRSLRQFSLQLIFNQPL